MTQPTQDQIAGVVFRAQVGGITAQHAADLIAGLYSGDLIGRVRHEQALQEHLTWALKYLRSMTSFSDDGSVFLKGSGGVELAGFASRYHAAQAALHEEIARLRADRLTARPGEPWKNCATCDGWIVADRCVCEPESAALRAQVAALTADRDALRGERDAVVAMHTDTAVATLRTALAAAQGENERMRKAIFSAHVHEHGFPQFSECPMNACATARALASPVPDGAFGTKSLDNQTQPEVE